MSKKTGPVVVFLVLGVLPFVGPSGCGGGGGGAGGTSGVGGAHTGGAGGVHTGGTGGVHTGGTGGVSAGGTGGVSAGGTGGRAGGAGGTAAAGAGGAGGAHTGGTGGTSAGGTGGAAGGAGGTAAGGTAGTAAGGTAGTAAGGTGGANRTDAGAGGDSGTDTGGVDAGPHTANLIVDGDAEAAVGSMDGLPVTVPGWTSTGEATAIPYDSAGYPASTDPGPPDRGTNFFAGGVDDTLSTLSQTIDVSSYATAIDAGQVSYVLSAYLGGYEIQEDGAVLLVTFETAGATSLGTGSIGPVTAEDRNDVTGLFLRSASGAVPAGTRSIQVTLTMTRVNGNNNDGYADDLSLVLGGLGL